MDYFSQIILPHSPQEFEDLNLTNDLKFMIKNNDKIKFSGPIIKKPDETKIDKIRSKYGIKDQFVVLACRGGGGHHKGHLDADTFQEIVLESFKRLEKTIPNPLFIFVTGPLSKGKVVSSNAHMKVVDYEPDLIELIQASDFVISHAGYNSVNEILTCKKPSAIIPYYTTDDDQYERARYLEKKRVSWLIIDRNPPKIAEIITKFYHNPDIKREIKSSYTRIDLKDGNLIAAKMILSAMEGGSEKENKIFIFNKCNNNCVICSALLHKGIYGKKEEVFSQLINLDRDKPLIFKGGEPYLRDNLFQIVEFAKEKGFKKIGIESNGRVFAYPKACKKFIDAKIGFFRIYIFNSDPEIHDKITGVKGSHEQALKGVDNLKTLGQEVELVNYDISDGDLDILPFAGLRSIKIRVTEKCNAQCRMCKFENSNSFFSFEKELTNPFFKCFIKDLKESG